MKVFVSYAAAELEAAQAIRHALRKAEIHAWLDVEGVRIGEAHQARILQAIADSQALVFLLSPRSVYRPWVEAELHEAHRHHRPVVVVRLAPCAIPSWVTPSYVTERYARPREADEELAVHLKRLARRAAATKRS